MTIYNTYIRVGFEDASGRITEVRYWMKTSFNDAPSNIAIVLSDATNITDTIETLSASKLAFMRLEIELGEKGVVDAGANNQVVAFNRTDDAGTRGSFQVPSWDTANYDQDANNLLDVNWLADASGLGSFLRDLENGSDLTNVEWAQSRARKGRQTVG